MGQISFSPGKVIFLVVFLGLVTRLILVSALHIPLTSDAADYYRMASAIYDGTGLKSIFMSAGYPLFLSGLFMVFGKTAEVAQYFNALLGGFSILLVYWLSKELFRSEPIAIIAAVLWAIYPPAILYAENLAKENLMIPLLLLYLLLVAKYAHSSFSAAIAAASGALLGLHALVGPALLVIAPIFLIQVFLKPNHIAKKIRDVLIYGLFVLIILAPWLYRNNEVYGQPLLNTNGGFNLYIGNNPSATGWFMSIMETPLGKSWSTLRQQLGEVGLNQYSRDRGVEYIKSHPVETIKMAIKKMFLFWTPPTHAGTGGDQSQIESLVRTAWLVEYVFLVFCALGLIIFVRPPLRQMWILYSSVGLYCAVHMLFYVIIRYRLPIMPLVTIAASCFIWQCYMWLKSREKKSAVPL